VGLVVLLRVLLELRVLKMPLGPLVPLVVVVGLTTAATVVRVVRVALLPVAGVVVLASIQERLDQVVLVVTDTRGLHHGKSSENYCREGCQRNC